MSQSISQDVVSRCLSLIPLVREHQGVSLDELAQLSRIPRTQIAEELSQVMMMCGVPPYFPHDYIAFSIQDDRVSIRFADHFSRPISLNPLEALALKLACESLSPPGKPVARGVASLLRKVEAAMSDEQRRQFRNLSRRLAVSDGQDLPGTMTARCALAVAERKEVLLDYQAAGRATSKERHAKPYGLLQRDGYWYLVAHDQSRDAVVHFRLDRIRAIKPTGATFEIPPDFRLDEHYQSPRGDEGADRPLAEVVFTGVGARWIREVAEPETLQQVGEREVIWRPRMGSVEGLASFILGFGPDAVVRTPESLRTRIVESLESCLTAHTA